MRGNGPVKDQSVSASVESGARLILNLPLQGREIPAGYIRRIGGQQMKPFKPLRALRTQHIKAYRLHRPPGAADVLREKSEGGGEPFHGTHKSGGKFPRQPQRHRSAARAQIRNAQPCAVPCLRLFPTQPRRPLAHEQLRFLAGGQNALAYGKLHVKKGPHAEQILQRTALRPLINVREKTAGQFLLRRFVPMQNQALPIHAKMALKQANRVKGRAVNPGLFQTAASFPIRLLQRHFAHPQPPTISSPFSGITSFMAAIATSIMESSGSCVVIRCIHSHGAAMMRVNQLSYRPQMRISS